MAERGTLFERLKAGLQQATEFEAGKRKLRVTEVAVPAPPGPFTAADVRRIREELSLSQVAFCQPAPGLASHDRELGAWPSSTLTGGRPSASVHRGTWASSPDREVAEASGGSETRKITARSVT